VHVSVIAETVDPDGRRVVLDASGWEHILAEHNEIASQRDALLAAVKSPEHRRPDARATRQRFWRKSAGPSRWLFVVVDYGEEPARIVTAYGNRKDPPGWKK
jgi:hypothetical protein